MLNGKKIRELYRANGMKQKDFAKAIEVAPSYLSQLEAGKRSPSFDTVIRMAEVLGVKIDEITTANPTRPPATESPVASVAGAVA